MRGEKLSDAIIYDKLNLLKKDFYGYIDRNSDKVDTNLPVFFGYVISALESSFPDITEEAHDDFIDSITYKILDASKNAKDFEYTKKVITNAIRLKKKKNADIGVNIVVGLKLLKEGDYSHALEFLKKHRELDAKIGTAVAFCYHVLSLREFKGDDLALRNHRPGEMELLARETLLELARVHPPLNRIQRLEIDDLSYLDKIFWQMIFFGLEWFPSERWFIEAGLKSAIQSKNNSMRKRLLDIGSERFYTDIHVLRELYYYKLENRDAAGAAGVVNQLIKQYPNDLEPIYLGLKLSLLMTKKITYHSFRKLATEKRMPIHVIELFDFAFDLLSGEQKEAFARLSDFEKEYPKFQYYAATLHYIARDIFSHDDIRIKRSKKTLLDSIELFCLGELNIKTII